MNLHLYAFNGDREITSILLRKRKRQNLIREDKIRSLSRITLLRILAGPKRFPTIRARLARTRPGFLISTARCNELSPRSMMRTARRITPDNTLFLSPVSSLKRKQLKRDDLFSFCLRHPPRLYDDARAKSVGCLRPRIALLRLFRVFASLSSSFTHS